VLNTLLKKLNILLIGARKRNKNVSVLVGKIEKYEKIKSHEFTNILQLTKTNINNNSDLVVTLF